ncbi:SMI1/KNR4 family protein [Celeribacter baekdonensis]|nr:SMI1/KNR4 family protein [Celeribacter baekdonensis]
MTEKRTVGTERGKKTRTKSIRMKFTMTRGKQMQRSEFIKAATDFFERKPMMLEMRSSDEFADDENISRVESELSAVLPDSYKFFLSQFGGGEFGASEFFSADAASEYSLVKQNQKWAQILPSGFLVFNDDQSGGWYMFNKLGDEKVFYFNPDGELVEIQGKGILDFISEQAFLR